jgi:hypothetical protein
MSRSDEPLFGVHTRGMGQRRLRRLRTRAPQRAEVQWFLSLAQLTVFDAWFEDDLRAGALTFNLVVRRRGATGGITEVVEARFLSMPQVQQFATHAIVSAGVVIDPVPASDWLDVIAPPGLDEWRPYGTSYSATQIGEPPESAGDYRAWDTDVASGGSFSPGGTPFGLWLQRRSVVRVPTPTQFSSGTIVSDVVNTSTTPPQTSWTTPNDSPAPVLELVDVQLGLWRFRRPDPGLSIEFSDRGTLVIGGPGAALRTAVSVSFDDEDFYPRISYEYIWDTV